MAYLLNGESSRSIMGRLLWSVNIISFVCLFFLCFVIVLSNKQQIEETTRSKAESISDFLQAVGSIYVANYDTSALESFAKIVASDNDFSYVTYFDKDGKPMTDSSKMMDAKDVVGIQKQIHDNAKRFIGTVSVGYRNERVRTSFMKTTLVCVGTSLLVQLILSGAVLLISRGIIRPLHKTLHKLGKTTSTLGETSDAISKFSENLSNGVNEQGEVVQETTAAMAEMSSMLSQTSTYAKASDNVMAAMTQKANNGMLIMNQMVEAMSSVQQANEQLKQMVDMIQEITTKTNVINDIVFKTQLLSFNASIEAARAGQHGRGFAVVAEEVGNLAKMSGKAAQEIGALLQDSEKQVNEIVKSTYERVSVGRTVTEQALKNFKDIANDIGTIASHIENITTAAREQELGVAQTTQAMSELSKTTELNNHVSQQANDASRTLKLEVQTLNSIARDIQSSITGTLQQSRRAWLQSFRNEDEETSNNDYGNDMPDSRDISGLSDRVVEMAKKHSNRNASSSDSKASNE